MLCLFDAFLFMRYLRVLPIMLCTCTWDANRSVPEYVNAQVRTNGVKKKTKNKKKNKKENKKKKQAGPGRPVKLAFHKAPILIKSLYRRLLQIFVTMHRAHSRSIRFV